MKPIVIGAAMVIGAFLVVGIVSAVDPTADIDDNPALMNLLRVVVFGGLAVIAYGLLRLVIVGWLRGLLRDLRNDDHEESATRHQREPGTDLRTGGLEYRR